MCLKRKCIDTSYLTEAVQNNIVVSLCMTAQQDSFKMKTAYHSDLFTAISYSGSSMYRASNLTLSGQYTPLRDTLYDPCGSYAYNKLCIVIIELDL